MMWLSIFCLSWQTLNLYSACTCICAHTVTFNDNGYLQSPHVFTLYTNFISAIHGNIFHKIFQQAFQHSHLSVKCHNVIWPHSFIHSFIQIPSQRIIGLGTQKNSMEPETHQNNSRLTLVTGIYCKCCERRCTVRMQNALGPWHIWFSGWTHCCRNSKSKLWEVGWLYWRYKFIHKTSQSTFFLTFGFCIYSSFVWDSASSL